MTAKLATDPPVSERQRRAMWAAAKGNSTLGIPREVGREFVGDARLRAAGIAFVDPAGAVLFVRRASGGHEGEWCLPGGGIEGTETPEEAAIREGEEEVGFVGDAPLTEVERRVSPEGVDFTTFRQPVPERFDPTLNHEHSAFRWAPTRSPPIPLHPGVRAVLSSIAMDSRGSARGIAFDRLLGGMVAPVRVIHRNPNGLALDRGSVRTYDRDGRLHVAKTHISKANVCPYVGREIPDWESLGLDPDRIYKLFRDPEELAKAAATFNNLPLLSQHVEVTADDHQPDLVIGSTGTDAEFADPYLDQSLVIWAKPGISAVESDEQKELSSAYRYRADMTPGEFKGEKYDGVMRDIVGNHVALVKEGRAGADVVVGDSMEKVTMSKMLLSRTAAFALGGVAVFIAPRLAMDAKVDLAPLFKDLTAKNFKTKKASIIEGIRGLTVGKLAADASIDDVVELMDKLESVKPGEDDATTANAGLPVVMPEDDTSMDELDPAKEFFKDKVGEDVMKAYDDFCAAKKGATDADETPEEKKKREEEAAAKKAAEDAAADPDKKPVTQKAMDEAIQATRETVIKTQRELRDAERAVRPYVGELAVTFDSGEQVLRHALKTLGVKGHDTIHASALQAVLEMQPVPGSASSRKPAPAMDAAGADSFAKRFPGAEKISAAS